jgi:hypothetical protein
MVLSKLKQLFSKKPSPGKTSAEAGANASMPKISWLEAPESPWGVRMLDLRPFTLSTKSTSGKEESAKNLASLQQDSGIGFVGQQAQSSTVTQASLRYPIDHKLADGVLHAPNEMEDKWALFFHNDQIICVRSWTRLVHLVASCKQSDNHIEITEIHGDFGPGTEEPGFTERMLDFLIRSHAIGMVHPVPLPTAMEGDPKQAAMWAFSQFGNRAWFASSQEVKAQNPDSPLRSHSLMHIAIAQGDFPTIEKHLADGWPIDLLAADGLAPLHWALACADPSVADWLIERGSPVDVRSSQGSTPLMNAVQSSSMPQVQQLLNHGADVNANDHRGFSSLHRACEMGFLEITQVLLEHGADLKYEACGYTARALAKKGKYKEIVGLLDRWKKK